MEKKYILSQVFMTKNDKIHVYNMFKIRAIWFKRKYCLFYNILEKLNYLLHDKPLHVLCSSYILFLL